MDTTQMNVLRIKRQKKTSNKKGSSYLLKGEGRYSDIEEEEDDDYDDSSDDEGNGFTFLQHDVVCSIQDEAAIPKGWILLDSQSTVNVFSNRLLHNKCDAKKNLVHHFLAAQGHYVPTTNIYQDNKITILLAKSGKTSSSKRTCHLNARYYFITDQIRKGQVKVAFCSTGDMLAEFFTKPLQ